MGGRVYAPVIGRFMSPDPFIADAFDSQSLNRYSYVRNNPLSRVDPSGFTDDCVFCVRTINPSFEYPGYLVAPGTTSVSFVWPSFVPRESGGDTHQLSPRLAAFDQGTMRQAAQAGAALGIGPMEAAVWRYFVSLPVWAQVAEATSTAARGVATRAGAVAARASATAGAALILTDMLVNGCGDSGRVGACAQHNEESGDDADETSEEASPQDKKLTPGEIEKLKEAGIDPEELKGGRRTGQWDLFKDQDGRIKIKPKDGSGPGEDTGINIKDL